jgi:hypothetical protein
MVSHSTSTRKEMDCRDVNEEVTSCELRVTLNTVTPAEAGVQFSFNLLDSRSPIKNFEDKFHGNDDFLRNHQL